MHVDLSPGGGEPAGVAGLPAQIEQGGHLPGEGLQGVGLQRVELARLVVEHADGAQGHAFPAADHRPGIEAQRCPVALRDFVGEARVQEQVRDDHQRFLLDGVRANRALQRVLACAHAKLAFEPLAFRVQKVDHRHRRPAELGRKLAQFVEFLFGRRVENAVALQDRQPHRVRKFSEGRRRFHGGRAGRRHPVPTGYVRPRGFGLRERPCPDSYQPHTASTTQ